jgi:hypothetical protein
VIIGAEKNAFASGFHTLADFVPVMARLLFDS